MNMDKSLCVYCGSGWRPPKDRVKNNQLQYQKYLKNKALRATFPSATSIWSPPSPQLWLTMPHQTLIFTLDTSWLLFCLTFFLTFAQTSLSQARTSNYLIIKDVLGAPEKWYIPQTVASYSDLHLLAFIYYSYDLTQPNQLRNLLTK